MLPFSFVLLAELIQQVISEKREGGDNDYRHPTRNSPSFHHTSCLILLAAQAASLEKVSYGVVAPSCYFLSESDLFCGFVGG